MMSLMVSQMMSLMSLFLRFSSLCLLLCILLTVCLFLSLCFLSPLPVHTDIRASTTATVTSALAASKQRSGGGRRLNKQHSGDDPNMSPRHQAEGSGSATSTSLHPLPAATSLTEATNSTTGQNTASNSNLHMVSTHGKLTQLLLTRPFFSTNKCRRQSPSH